MKTTSDLNLVLAPVYVNYVLNIRRSLEQFRQNAARDEFQWLVRYLSLELSAFSTESDNSLNPRSSSRPQPRGRCKSISSRNAWVRREEDSSYRTKLMERDQPCNATTVEETFASLISKWLANRYPGDNKQGYRVRGFLERLVLPHVGGIALRELTVSQMSQVLDHIAITQRKYATSRLCRMWMRAALRYAKTHKLTTREQFAELMEIEPARHKTTHKTPLTSQQIRDLWFDLEKLLSRQTVLGIRLLLLTFVRPVELRCARWSEFDLNGSDSECRPIWRVPAERVKMHTPHNVPLSRQVVCILRELHTLTGGGQLLFPGAQSNKPVTRQAWRDSLCTIAWQKRFSLHACRATASTLIRELDFGTNDQIEIQLGHFARSATRASYDFATLLRQRHAMMQSWSDYVFSLLDDSATAAG